MTTPVGSGELDGGDGFLPRYLTVREFAELARISRSTAYRLVAAGVVPARRFGERLVVHRSALALDPPFTATASPAGRPTRARAGR